LHQPNNCHITAHNLYADCKHTAKAQSEDRWLTVKNAILVFTITMKNN